MSHVPKYAKNWKLMDRFDWKQKQTCHHCGCDVYRKKDALPNLPNTATIDHIFSRTDIRRYCHNGGKWVLSCHKCNDYRNNIEIISIKSLIDKLNLYDTSIHLITFYKIQNQQFV